MFTVKGRIEGIAPFLYNRMIDPSVLDSGVSGAPQTKAERVAEASQRVYRNGHGLYVPAWNFKRCLLDGAKKGKIKISKTGLYDLLYATAFVQGDPVFGKDDPDFIHECVGRIPPKRGAAAIIRRPALSPGWSLPFELLIADDRIPPESIRRALETAGLLVGIGAWRPEYGRFIVKEFS
jgi:hypothetical protein